MTEAIDLPSELHQISDRLSTEPPEVRGLARYLLVMSLVDSRKAKILRVHLVDGQLYLILETVKGKVFKILRPPISMATELGLREQVMATWDEHED